MVEKLECTMGVLEFKTLFRGQHSRLPGGSKGYDLRLYFARYDQAP